MKKFYQCCPQLEKCFSPPPGKIHYCPPGKNASYANDFHKQVNVVWQKQKATYQNIL